MKISYIIVFNIALVNSIQAMEQPRPTVAFVKDSKIIDSVTKGQYPRLMKSSLTTPNNGILGDEDIGYLTTIWGHLGGIHHGIGTEKDLEDCVKADSAWGCMPNAKTQECMYTINSEEKLTAPRNVGFIGGAKVDLSSIELAILKHYSLKKQQENDVNKNPQDANQTEHFAVVKSELFTDDSSENQKYFKALCNAYKTCLSKGTMKKGQIPLMDGYVKIPCDASAVGLWDLDKIEAIVRFQVKKKYPQLSQPKLPWYKQHRDKILCAIGLTAVNVGFHFWWVQKINP